VLARALSSNGLGGYSGRTFAYLGLKQDVRRGLSLGFTQVNQLDEARGMLTATRYNQTFPIMQTENQVEMGPFGGQIRERVNTTVNFASSIPGVFRVQMPSRTESFYEPNGSLTVSRTTTQTYDAYNNVLVKVSEANDGYSKTSTTAYSNDPLHWLIGLPTSMSLRGAAPGVPAITRVTTYGYDLRGFQNRDAIEPGTPLEVIRTYTLDSFGNVTALTTSGPDFDARTESTRFDARGLFPVSSTNALGQVESRVFDTRFGVLVTQIGPNKMNTTFEHDPLGRELRTSTPDGRDTTYERVLCASARVACPATGRISVRTELEGEPPVYEVTDVMGREVRRSTLGFDGRAVHNDTEYDERGRIRRRSLEYFQGELIPWIAFGYDELDRMTAQVEPDGAQTTWAYDKLTTTTRNALQQTRTEVKNSQDKLLRATDANGKSIAYVYDAFDNPLSVTDPQSNVIRSVFDRLGRRTQLVDPDLGTSTTVYDALGQVIRETNAKNQTRLYTYDKIGRPLVRTDVDGQTTWVHDTAQFGIGKPASVQGRFGTKAFSKTFVYDSFGRPSKSTTVIDGRSYTTTWKFDAQGRESGLVYPGGFETRMVYNGVGHLMRVENATTNSVYWTAQERNAAGQYTRDLLGNGLSTRRVFDPLTRHVKEVKTGAGAASDVQNLSYQWDLLGNLTKRSNLNRKLEESLTYDALNRLTSAAIPGRTPLTYAYDAIGNITSKSDVGAYTYGTGGVRPHAVTKTTGAVSGTYAYDANGNETQRFDAAGVQIGLSDYTSFDKPSRITRSSGANLVSSDFRYDDDRALLYRSDFAASTNETTTTFYAGDSFEETLRADGKTEQKNYVRSPDGVIAVHTAGTAGAPMTRYLHRDHLGSIQMITDQAGAIAEELSYDPFGRRRNADWTAAAKPIQSGFKKGFGGHEQLDHLELVHMGGRVYDPVLGRFTSADPYVQFPDSTQGFNRYSYVNNNPLTFTDPSGFFLKRLGKFFKRLIKKIGTVFRNPAFLLKLGTCVLSLGSACDWIGLLTYIGQAALYGNEAPNAASWSRFLPPSGSGNDPTVRSCGINGSLGCTETKLPSPQEQWRKEQDESWKIYIGEDEPGVVIDDETYGQNVKAGLERVVRDISDLAFRFGVFDYKEPLGGSYVAETATVIPFLKFAKLGKVAKYGDRSIAVIGHFPDYLKRAEELGDAARRFNIPEKFAKLMSDAEIWAANQKFLDRAIRDRVTFELATAKARVGSFFEKEINYLLDKGYRYSADGRSLLPPTLAN
jgi:RHS repeat-associated protein